MAVTGSSGYIGAKLLEHLEELPWVRRLVTFDVRPMPAPIHNIAAFRQDVSNPIHEDLNQQRVDTVVHLASTRGGSSNRRDTSEAGQRDLEMLRSVLHSCAQAEVGHFIYMSSHSVYGAKPENPLPVGENYALSAVAGFPYAYAHLEAERVLEEFSQTASEMNVTILRSCPVLGTSASMPGLREFYFTGGLTLLEHNPPLQFVHEDDLARILCLTIAAEVSGTYNVAGDGVVFLRELANSLAIRQSLLPSPMVRFLNRTVGSIAAADDHGLARWPVIMSTSKLRRATGYRFLHTGMEAVAAFANSDDEVQRRLHKGGEIRVGDSSHLQTIVVHEDR